MIQLRQYNTTGVAYASLLDYDAFDLTMERRTSAFYGVDGLKYDYSVGSLALDEQGRCMVKDPTEVYFQMPEGASTISGTITVGDAHGNANTCACLPPTSRQPRTRPLWPG